MKRFLLILLIFLFLKGALSNPLMPPAKLLVSEIYFTDTNWVLELVVNDLFFDEYPANLDSVKLITTQGESYFKAGMDIEESQVLVVTAEDLIDSVGISKTGDIIKLIEISNGKVLWNSEWEQEVSFGTYNPSCAPPAEGQSLVMQYFLLFSSWYEDFYWMVHEDKPTLGNHPLSCQAKAEFSGKVLDANDRPVENAIIHYMPYHFKNRQHVDSIIPESPEISTNGEGIFKSELYSRKYSDIPVYLKDSLIGKVQFEIRHNSPNNYIFRLDDYEKENAAEVKSYPNPAIHEVNFEVRIPLQKELHKPVIKLYDSNGFLVEIIPVPGHHCCINWSLKEKSLSPGYYFYTLENNNKKLSSNKLIITR